MSGHDASIPRVFLIRHGETDWAKTGRYTGVTDIDLNLTGIAQIRSTAATLVGHGKFIEPSRLAHAFASPRKRAGDNFRLLQLPSSLESTVTDDIREWDYGEYEGLTSNEIKARRSENGLDQETDWNIWSDGCVGGETPDQVTERLSRLIEEIREIHKPHMNGESPPMC